MQNQFTKLALLGGLFFAVASCEKDESKVVLNAAASPQLTASSATAVLDTAGARTGATAVTYTWTPADYSFQSATTYTLQLAAAGTNFATPIEIAVGSGLTKTLTVSELNAVYNSLDCSLGATNNPQTPLEVRVKAGINEYVDAMYSPVKTITAAPYQDQTPPDSWGVIGSATAGGWNSDQDMTYDFCARVYKITIALNGTAGSNEFKFRSKDSWDVNYGDDSNDHALERNGANIAVPNGTGTYDIVLDLNATPKPTYTITKR